MTVVLTYLNLTHSHLTFSSTTSAIPGLQTKYKIELFFVIFLAIYKIHITLFYIIFFFSFNHFFWRPWTNLYPKSFHLRNCWSSKTGRKSPLKSPLKIETVCCKCLVLLQGLRMRNFAKHICILIDYFMALFLMRNKLLQGKKQGGVS